MSNAHKDEVTRNIERAQKCARDEGLTSTDDIIVVYTPERLIEAGREFRKKGNVLQQENSQLCGIG